MTTFTGLWRWLKDKTVSGRNQGTIYQPEIMRRSRRTIIKTETREIFIVRRTGHANPIRRCHECGGETEWLSLAASVKITGLDWREIFRRIETGAIHFQETSERQPVICKNSLAAAFRADSQNTDWK